MSNSNGTQTRSVNNKLDWMINETDKLYNSVLKLRDERENKDKIIKDQLNDIEYMRNLIKSYETEIMKLRTQLNDGNTCYTVAGKKFDKSVSKECMNGCGFTVNISEKSDYCMICSNYIDSRSKKNKNEMCGYCMSGTIHLNQECMYA
jgi:hypothetical protein